ncbi:MAG: response regulator [Spirochaetota bacterium]|nr:response regulator [Spirochaetota bacterium]
MPKKFDNKLITVLLAEDNPADQQLTKRVFEDAKIKNDLYIVEDGVDLMNYLNRKEKYSNPITSPRPDLILLDINMPRMDGKQALKNIKNDINLKSIPVIIFTTSSYEKDIIESYNLGVNAYVTKPLDIDEFMCAVKNLESFWMILADLPSRRAEFKDYK